MTCNQRYKLRQNSHYDPILFGNLSVFSEKSPRIDVELIMQPTELIVTETDHLKKTSLKKI